MELKVLGSQGGSAPARHLPSFLLDGHVLLEAGSVTATLGLSEQLQLREVLVSHAHLDHAGGLPFLADNRFCNPVGSGRSPSLGVSSIAPVIDDLQAHLFNGRLWPDFTRVPTERDPALRLQTLETGKSNVVAGHLTVIPVPVHHTVPAVRFVIHDGTAALVFSGDTGPTSRLWEVARELGNGRAIIVETSFPNRLDGLAERSGHLTPAQLARELDKMPPCPVWVYHIKPAFHEEILEELAPLDGHVRVLSDGEIDVL